MSTPRLWSSFEVEIQGSGPSGLLHETRQMHRMKSMPISFLLLSFICPIDIQLLRTRIR